MCVRFLAGFVLLRVTTTIDTAMSDFWRVQAEQGSIVWRIQANADCLFADFRNPETRQSKFAAFRLLTGELLWELPQPGWWYSLEAATSHELIIQTFAESSVPTPLNVEIRSVSSGELYLSLGGTISSMTGDTLNSSDGTVYKLHGSTVELLFPELTLWDGISPDACSAEELREAGRAVRSWFTPVSEDSEPSYSQQLVVYDASGNTVYEDVPMARTQYPQSNTFFAVRTSAETMTLIYVRDLNEIVVVPV